MPDPLEALSDDELQALSENRLEDLSDHALSLVAGERGAPPKVTGYGRLIDAVSKDPQGATIFPGEGPLSPSSPTRGALRALNTTLFRAPEAVTTRLPGKAGEVARKIFQPQQPGVADVAGDVIGFMLPGGGPSRVAAGVQRGVAARLGARGTRFLGKSTARAAGGAASAAPFALADLPTQGPVRTAEEAANLAAMGAVLPNVIPAAKMALGGTIRGVDQALAGIHQRGLRARGVPVSKQPTTLGKLFSAPLRQEALFKKRIAQVNEASVKGQEEIRANFRGQLNTERIRNEGQVQAANEALARAQGDPARGQEAVQAASRVQSRIVGEEGYASKVYKEYDTRLNALEQRVADNEALQIGPKELGAALSKEIPRDASNAFVASNPGEADVLKRISQLPASQPVGVREIQKLLKELRAAVTARRGAARRMTPADHSRMTAVSNVIDLLSERNPGFGAIQNWYKGHAKVLDRTFKLLRPRGDVYETATRLEAIGRKPNAIRAASLQELESKAGEMGVHPQVQQEAEAIGAAVRDAEETLARLKRELPRIQRTLGVAEANSLQNLQASTENRLATVRDVMRRYNVSIPGRSAGVVETPIGFPVPTVDVHPSRIRTLTAEYITPLIRGLTEEVRTIKAGLTPGFIRRGGGSRLLTGYLATETGREPQ